MYEYNGTGYVLPVNNNDALVDLVNYFVNIGKLDSFSSDVIDIENNNLCGDYCPSDSLIKATLDGTPLDYDYGIFIVRDEYVPSNINEITRVLLDGASADDYHGTFHVECTE